jgi:hypothetical protein
LKTKLESNKYVGKKEELTNDIQEIVKNYNQKAKGENKGEVIAEFLANLNPVLLNI